MALKVEQLLDFLVKQNAYEVQLTPGSPPVCRMEVDGALKPINQIKLTVDDLKDLAGQILAPKDKKEFEENGFVNVSVVRPNLGRFSGTMSRKDNAVSIALRNINIELLLEYMVKHNASDVYLTFDYPPAYRIEGITQAIGDHKFTMEDTEDLVKQMTNDKQKKEFEETYEVNLALFYPKLGRFRVNIFRQRNCAGAVIRQIKVDILTTEQLKLPPILNDIIMAKRGLVIVVGATGSGKSTSLAAMIDYRNANSPGHIITIEDPVEYVHPHKKCVITQREVGTDTVSFKAALKNTLRQAPDVILLGEIRDTETMEHAVEFAETGHLSIGTLHANNANQAIERIMNFFPIERHEQIYQQLSLNLRAIVSQRLVRTVDGKRRAAVEIMMNKPRIADLILKGEIGLLKEAMEQLVNDGLQTFDQALFKFYKDGIISFQEALINADSANNLKLKIKTAGLPIPGEESSTEGFAFKAPEEHAQQGQGPGKRPAPARPPVKK